MKVEDLNKCDDVQKIYKSIFGIYDIDKALLWMAEECGEVIGAVRKGKNIQEIKEELGDLLNWIFSVSNILGIDISSVIKLSLVKEIDRQEEKYGRLKYVSDVDVDAIMNLYKEIQL